MAHDPSNPFQRMAKTLAERQRDKELSSAASRPSEGRKGDSRVPAGKRPPAGRDKFPAPADEDEDAALFLDAMSNIRPMRDHGRQAASPESGQTPEPRPGESRSAGERARSAPERSPRPNGLAESGTAFPARVLADRLRAKQTPAPVRTPEETAPAGAAPGDRAAASPAGIGKAVPEETRTGPIKNMRTFLEAMGARESDEAPRGEEERLFAKAMRGVAPVAAKGRQVHAAAGENERAVPSVDPAKALRDLLEGRLEFALYHSDEFMEGHVVGIDPMVMARLRAGQFSPEAHLDLHGQNAVQAQGSLTWFIKNAYQRGLRTVLVVTGRGKNSPDGVGVLRPLLQRWLSKDPFKRVVLAFCTAKSGDGGPGAVYVLLRKDKKSLGKIVWEHSPSDDDFPDV